MVGADESTELWQHPKLLFLLLLFDEPHVGHLASFIRYSSSNQLVHFTKL